MGNSKKVVLNGKTVSFLLGADLVSPITHSMWTPVMLITWCLKKRVYFQWWMEAFIWTVLLNRQSVTYLVSCFQSVGFLQALPELLLCAGLAWGTLACEEWDEGCDSHVLVAWTGPCPLFPAQNCGWGLTTLEVKSFSIILRDKQMLSPRAWHLGLSTSITNGTEEMELKLGHAG